MQNWGEKTKFPKLQAYLIIAKFTKWIPLRYLGKLIIKTLITILIREISTLGVVAHTCNPIMWGAEAVLLIKFFMPGWPMRDWNLELDFVLKNNKSPFRIIKIINIWLMTGYIIIIMYWICFLIFIIALWLCNRMIFLVFFWNKGLPQSKAGLEQYLFKSFCLILPRDGITRVH